MAQHRTLMQENINGILYCKIMLNSVNYQVVDRIHRNNGVWTLCLKCLKGAGKGAIDWVEVLVENDKIIYVDG